jgi:hypothetical protein
MHWSKALLASNLHYIEDQYLPMPFPAEYIFFFTHDLLLTSLGAVYFDVTSDQYGVIDKPTFLCAGGLYLHVLYQFKNILFTIFILNYYISINGSTHLNSTILYDRQEYSYSNYRIDQHIRLHIIFYCSQGIT